MPQCFRLDNLRALKVYRRLDAQEHVDAFLRGEIWLTTLEKCRVHDVSRRDIGEATSTYNTGHLESAGDDPEFKKAAERALIRIERCGPVQLFNNAVIKRVPDAFLLCTAERDDLIEFGKHCIEIPRPHEFFDHVTRAIMEHTFTVIGAVLDRIRYGGRSSVGFEPEFGPVGFVKPVSFEREQEVRFMWDVVEDPKPQAIMCPAVASLCKQIC